MSEKRLPVGTGFFISSGKKDILTSDGHKTGFFLGGRLGNEIWGPNRNVPWDVGRKIGHSKTSSKSMQRRLRTQLNDRLSRLNDSITYELNDDGPHTYSVCQHCHEHSTRTGKCAVCLDEERSEIVSLLTLVV